MPECAPGVTGGVSSAPTIAAWPRGSQTTPRRKWSALRRKSSRRSAIVAPAGCGQPSTITRVGSPSVWESTTRSTRASPDRSGIELDGPNLGVELARGGTLLAAPRAGSLHAAERRVGIDAGRVSIHAHHADGDLVDVAERAAQVAREERRAESVDRVVGERDRVIEVVGRKAREDGTEDLSLRE